jgi:toxin ParE1/3/4
MNRVHYSTFAAEDLYENAAYIARDKPEAANRWIERMEEVCQLLVANPELGQLRTTSSHGSCRSFVSSNYVLFFRSVADGIEVVRIVRGERDLDRL